MDIPLSPNQGSEASAPKDQGLPAGRQGKKRWAIALASVAILVGLYLIGTSDTRLSPKSETTTKPVITILGSGEEAPVATDGDTASDTTTADSSGSAPSKTVDKAGAFKLFSKTAYSCTADAPGDWSMQSTSQSNVADIFGPGKTMYAGYGMQAVNTSLAGFASSYQAPLNNPDLYSEDPAAVAKAYGEAIVTALGGSGSLSYTDEVNESVGDYSLRSVAGGGYKGAIFFHTKGFPGDSANYSYALPMYFAFTTDALWEANGMMVAQVAASIRCTTQYQPRDQYVVTAGSSDSGSSSGDSNGADDGYNPQLGTETVHDESTGENYLVDPSQHWSADGPDGGGYYKQNGTDYTKLTPGRSD